MKVLMLLYPLAQNQPSWVDSFNESSAIIFIIGLGILLFLLFYSINKPKKLYYGNGKLKSKEKFKNGRRNGVFKYYHYNGRLKGEGNYKDDKQHGISKFYHENGKLLSEGNYKDGNENGLFKSFYQNGQLDTEANMQMGKYHGVMNKYYEDGQLKAEGNWKNDKEDGTIKHYHENGQLSLEEKWKNGKNIPPNKSYDEKGQLVSKKKSTKNQPKDYEKQYEKALGKEFLSIESMVNEYKFVKSCYSRMLKGEKFTEEEFAEIIIKHHLKFNSKTLGGKLGTYQTISQLTGQWINGIEEEDEIKFKGTESFEQYNSISQIIYNVLTTEMMSRAVKGEKYE